MDYMRLIRRPTYQEERLIGLLVEKSCLPISLTWSDGLMVCPMNDGMMGSLYLFPKGEVEHGRKFGKQISSFQFTNTDGVEVLVSLNVDKKGDLFELDVWKTNFDKLINLPEL